MKADERPTKSSRRSLAKGAKSSEGIGDIFEYAEDAATCVDESRGASSFSSGKSRVEGAVCATPPLGSCTAAWCSAQGRRRGEQDARSVAIILCEARRAARRLLKRARIVLIHMRVLRTLHAMAAVRVFLPRRRGGPPPSRRLEACSAAL